MWSAASTADSRTPTRGQAPTPSAAFTRNKSRNANAVCRPATSPARRGSFRKPPLWKPYHPPEAWLAALIGRGRLLDFGCGAGAFLERMHRQGWEVTGMDASPEMVEEIRTKLRFRVLVGTLPHPELTPESFDAVSMWHALEHVHQPRETLYEAWRLLSPGRKTWSSARLRTCRARRGAGSVRHGMAGACRIISLTSPRGRCKKWSAKQDFRSSG